MDLRELQKNWDKFGRTDPLWAILVQPEKKGNKWRTDEFCETGVREIDLVIRYIKSLKIDIPRGKALDFGCAVGRLTQALAGYFDEIYGVDIAPFMIELAIKYNRHGEKCKYYLNETDNLKLFADRSFSFIYSHITLQHMEPRYSAVYIKEFLRILIPQGVLIFQLPSARERDEFPNKSFITDLKLFIRFLGWRAISYLRRQPIMEMYATKREDVIELVQKNGGTILDIIQDQSAASWISLRYSVTKE
jgi:SAM-dependent methyltransferase